MEFEDAPPRCICMCDIYSRELRERGGGRAKEEFVCISNLLGYHQISVFCDYYRFPLHVNRHMVNEWERKREKLKESFSRKNSFNQMDTLLWFSIYAFAKRYGSGFRSGRLFVVWDCFRFFLCFSI